MSTTQEQDAKAVTAKTGWHSEPTHPGIWVADREDWKVPKAIEVDQEHLSGDYNLPSGCDWFGPIPMQRGLSHGLDAENEDGWKDHPPSEPGVYKTRYRRGSVHGGWTIEKLHIFRDPKRHGSQLMAEPYKGSPHNVEDRMRVNQMDREWKHS